MKSKIIVLVVVLLIMVTGVIAEEKELKNEEGAVYTVTSTDTYTFAGKPIEAGKLTAETYKVKNGALLPVNNEDTWKPFTYLDKNGALQQGSFKPKYDPATIPTSKTSTSSGASDTTTVFVGDDDSQIEVDNSLVDFVQKICEDKPCTSTSSKSFSSDTMDVNLIGDAKVVRNSENGETWIYSDSEEISLKTLDDNLIPEGATNVVVKGNTVEYDFGDTHGVVTETAYGASIKVDDEDNALIIGNQRITMDGDEWVYGDEKYQQFVPEGPSFRLNGKDGNYLSVSVSEEGKVIEQRNGNEITRTLTHPTGRISENEYKLIDGKEVFQKRTTYDSKNNKLSDQNAGEGNTFYDKNGRPIGFCKEDGCKKQDEADYVFKYGKEGCQYDDPTCYGKPSTEKIPKWMSDETYGQQLMQGDLSFQVWGAAFLGGGRTGERISARPLSNSWTWWNENFVDRMDKFFARNLGVGFFESAICKTKWPVEPDSGNVGIIETPQGTYQAVAHIEFERKEVPAILCTDNECPNEMECRDNLCYKEGEISPAEGFLYKISWGVVAPRDEAYIQYGGNTGNAVSFNLQLRPTVNSEDGAILLFKNKLERATKDTIKLEKGKSSSSEYASLISEYSAREFQEVCIVWGQQTPVDLSGEPLLPICDKQTEYAEAEQALRSDETGSSATTAEDIVLVGFNQ